MYRSLIFQYLGDHFASFVQELEYLFTTFGQKF